MTQFVEPLDRQHTAVSANYWKLVRWDAGEQQLIIESKDQDSNTARLSRENAILLAKRILFSLDVSAQEIWDVTVEGIRERSVS